MSLLPAMGLLPPPRSLVSLPRCPEPASLSSPLGSESQGYDGKRLRAGRMSVATLGYFIEKKVWLRVEQNISDKVAKTILRKSSTRSALPNSKTKQTVWIGGLVAKEGFPFPPSTRTPGSNPQTTNPKHQPAGKKKTKGKKLRDGFKR